MNQTCTEVVLLGSGQREHSNPGGKIRRGKSGADTAADFGLGKPLIHREQNQAGKIRGAHSHGLCGLCGLGKPLTKAKSGEGKIPATDFGIGKPLTHKRRNPREAKLPATDCGPGKPLTHGRGGKIRGRQNSQLRILDSENHSPTKAKLGGKIPAADFGTRKTSHPP